MQRGLAPNSTGDKITFSKFKIIIIFLSGFFFFSRDPRRCKDKGFLKRSSDQSIKSQNHDVGRVLLPCKSLYIYIYIYYPISIIDQPFGGILLLV